MKVHKLSALFSCAAPAINPNGGKISGGSSDGGGHDGGGPAPPLPRAAHGRRPAHRLPKVPSQLLFDLEPEHGGGGGGGGGGALPPVLPPPSSSARASPSASPGRAGADAAAALAHLTAPWSAEEAELGRQVSLALDAIPPPPPTSCPSSSADRVVALARVLRALGHAVTVRVGLGPAGGAGGGCAAPGAAGGGEPGAAPPAAAAAAGECLRNLRHTFLAVTVAGGDGGGGPVAAPSPATFPHLAAAAAGAAGGAPSPPPAAFHSPARRTYIVDPAFADQFAVAAHALTPRYAAVLACLPPVFVGTDARAAALVDAAAGEMAAAFAARGVALPPWRRAGAMLTKWRPRRSEDVAAGAAERLGLVPGGEGGGRGAVPPASLAAALAAACRTGEAAVALGAHEADEASLPAGAAALFARRRASVAEATAAAALRAADARPLVGGVPGPAAEAARRAAALLSSQLSAVVARNASSSASSSGGSSPPRSGSASPRQEGGGPGGGAPAAGFRPAAVVEAPVALQPPPPAPTPARASSPQPPRPVAGELTAALAAAAAEQKAAAAPAVVRARAAAAGVWRRTLGGGVDPTPPSPATQQPHSAGFLGRVKAAALAKGGPVDRALSSASPRGRELL